MSRDLRNLICWKKFENKIQLKISKNQKELDQKMFHCNYLSMEKYSKSFLKAVQIKKNIISLEMQSLVY